MKGLLGVVAILFMVVPSYGQQTCAPRVQQFVPRHAFDNGQRQLQYGQQQAVINQQLYHQQQQYNNQRQIVRQQFVLENQYNNGFNHYNNNNAIVIQDKIIQFDNFNNVYAVPVTNFGLDYFYRVITEPERQRVADRVADTVVERLLQRIREEQAAQPAPAPIPVPVAPVAPVAPNPPTVKPRIPTGDLDDQVFDILTTNCAVCHTAGDEKGKLAIFNDNGDLNDLTVDQKWKIWDRTDGGGLPRDKVMPKNGEPLSGDDVAILREWVRR